MSDSTSDEGDEGEAGPPCEVCGDPVAGSGRRVVPTVEDGQAVHRNFCSDDCLEEWRD